jgi:hypothetical protein
MVCSHKASVLIAEITADRSPIVSRMSAAEEQFLLGACCIGTSTRVAVCQVVLRNAGEFLGNRLTV